MSKRKILIVVIILGLILIFTGVFLTYKQESSKQDEVGNVPSRDENKEEDKGRDEEEIIETPVEGEIVSSTNINLADYSTNIIITEGGEYFLTGNFNNSVYVDSEALVSLTLHNVNINTEKDAAIANIKTNELIINVSAGTNNTLSDGKEKTAHDGCLFSNGPLNIKGEGNLKVYGNQYDGEGITTKNNNLTIDGGNISIYSVDDGINTGATGGTIIINNGYIYIEAGGDALDSNKDVIINGGIIEGYAGLSGINTSIDANDKYIVNGGKVIATGTDHLILPDSSSNGKVICFELIDSIPKDELVVLLDENDNVIFSIKPKSNIKTIFYTSNNLLNGKYYLYSGGMIENNKYIKGNLVTINKNNEYLVDGNINAYIQN